MSSPYAGADAFPATAALPDDGDAKTAASVNVPLETVFDRTVYLANFLLGAHPGGLFSNVTLKGNTTIRNDGTSKAVTVVDVDINLDDQTTVLSRAVWNVAQGAWSFGGAFGQFVSFSCPTFYSQPISLAGQGRVRTRRLYASGSGARSINIGACDLYMIRLGDVAGGDKGVLANGTADGSLVSWDTIRIVSSDSTGFPLYNADGVTAINDAVGSPIVMVRNPSAPGEHASVLLVWNGAVWEWIG